MVCRSPSGSHPGRVVFYTKVPCDHAIYDLPEDPCRYLWPVGLVPFGYNLERFFGDPPNWVLPQRRQLFLKEAVASSLQILKLQELDFRKRESQKLLADYLCEVLRRVGPLPFGALFSWFCGRNGRLNETLVEMRLGDLMGQLRVVFDPEHRLWSLPDQR